MTFWLELEEAEDVASAAADAIQEYARLAIQKKGEFKLVLAGGTTPQRCYQLLAQRNLDWHKWKLFYGDERCLPVDHQQRNHQMVLGTGLADQVARHYIMPAELGPLKGAALYESQIKDEMPFDFVLLGMGEDGHTASLFPGMEQGNLDPDTLVIPVYDAPKPPPERVSLTRDALQGCLKLLVLIAGESKRDAVQRWKRGEILPVTEVADCCQSAVYVEKEILI